MALFGKRDLGLALSDKIEDNDLAATHDLTAADVTQAGLKAKIDPTKKIQRLRPGMLPSWALEAAEGQEVELSRHRLAKQEAGDEDEYLPAQTAIHEDRRLLRLEQARRIAQEGRKGRRETYEAEVIAADDEEDDQDEFVPGDAPVGGRIDRPDQDEDDEEAITRRRAAIRERLKNLKMAEEILPKAEVDEEKEADEEESEYETDSESSEEEGLLSMPKPIFIPKHKRELLKEQEKEEKEYTERERRREMMLEQRKRDTRNLVAEEVRKEAEAANFVDEGYGSDAGAPDDIDRPEDDALEFEKWRLRELFRIKNDREQRLARAREKAEIERRRDLTDEQRAAEDAKLGLNKPKQKAKWKFMQKYYHKGAFYMDDDSVRQDDVRARAGDAPTGEDKFNKEALPGIMQVKKFGRSGNTKYTHLMDQDTTRKGLESVWALSERDRQHGLIQEQRKFIPGLGGTGDINKAGRKKKKA